MPACQFKLASLAYFSIFFFVVVVFLNSCLQTSNTPVTLDVYEVQCSVVGMHISSYYLSTVR